MIDSLSSSHLYIFPHIVYLLKKIKKNHSKHGENIQSSLTVNKNWNTFRCTCTAFSDSEASRQISQRTAAAWLCQRHQPVANRHGKSAPILLKDYSYYVSAELKVEQPCLCCNHLFLFINFAIMCKYVLCVVKQQY